MDANNYQQVPNGNVPGKGVATASLILGILSVVLWLCFFIPDPTGGAIKSGIGIVLAIVGLILASNAKKQGFVGGLQTAGFVLSLIGLILCAISFVSCLACWICAGATGAALNEAVQNGDITADQLQELSDALSQLEAQS